MGRVDFLAHIRVDKETNSVECRQSVLEHCRRVAEYAFESLKDVNLSGCGYLVGLIHDMGKMKAEFRDYIEAAAVDENVKRGMVKHSFVACRYLLERYHGVDFGRNRIFCEILAYVVGAHHGLFDCISSDGANGFDKRLHEDSGYEEAVGNYLSDCVSEPVLQKYVDDAFRELSDFWDKLIGYDKEYGSIHTLLDERKDERCFYVSLLVRLLLSALIDADHRDSFEFDSGQSFPSVTVDWDECLRNVEGMFGEPSKTADANIVRINEARSRFSDSCLKLADKSGGVFRLNLPTGAGKTLSSLRAALHHVIKQDKRRIFYVMPLLAVTKQNAEVIRKAVGNEGCVLEHHSDVVFEKDGDQKRFTEDWSSPFVITTLVQFLNTLFAGKSSNIRRLKSLANSVVVIDEVQTVPMNMLSLFNMAMNFLSVFCNTTVVLCSATQPSLEEVHYKLHSVEDLVPFDNALWDVFKRVDIELVSSLKLQEVSGFLLKELDLNLLCICNTKKEARVLCQGLRGYCKVYHLSAGMCVAHRNAVFKRIKESLASGEGFICISTQLIEAGVDISFQKVVRFPAGLDSIAQSAGRCNRNYEYGCGTLYIIESIVDEKLGNLSLLKDGQVAFWSVMVHWHKDPEELENYILSNKAVSCYYSHLYGDYNPQDMDYKISDLDASMVNLLGFNKLLSSEYKYDFCMKQSFRAAADSFSVFDDTTVSVVVPYQDGKWLANELRMTSKAGHINQFYALVKQLREYTVSLFKNQFDKIEEQGGIEKIFFNGSTVYVLFEDFYNAEYGVTDEMVLGFKEV